MLSRHWTSGLTTTGGSGPTSLFATELGIPTIMTGNVANAGSRIHSPNESVRLDDYFEGLFNDSVVDGKSYQVPWYQAVPVELVNTEHAADVRDVVLACGLTFFEAVTVLDLLFMTGSEAPRFIWGTPPRK